MIRTAVAPTAVLFAVTATSATEKLNQPPKGFKALFNGKDLSGWRGHIGNPKQVAKMSEEQRAKAQAAANKRMMKHWKVEDGVLVFDGQGKSLVTAKDYGDFELYVDWKIHERGDSGIYLRGQPQVQIWDPNQHKVGSGGLYNNKKHASRPSATADNPIGEWNTFHIKMVADKVTVKLNGTTVVDQVPLENYWDRGQPLPESGPIELQNHGNKLYFRNIFVKEL